MSAVPTGVSAYLWREVLKLLPHSRRIALVGARGLSDRLEIAINSETSGYGANISLLKVASLRAGATAEAAGRNLTQLTSWAPDAVILCEDSEKLSYLSALNSLPWRTFPRVVVHGTEHHDVNLQIVNRLENSTGEISHAVGYRYLKAHFFELLRHSKRRGLKGDVAELGVFRGGTLLLLAKILDELDFAAPCLIGFDTWSGFPERRCLLDMYNSPDFEYRDYHHLTEKLSSGRIKLVRGDIIETIRELDTRQLLLTFIDTDNYTPTNAALPVVAAQTVQGGAIVFDHYFADEAYNDAIGDGVAAMEFFEKRTDFLNLSGTGVFLKL